MQNVLQLQVYLEIFQHHSGHICPKRVKKVVTRKLFKPLKPIVKLDFFRHKVALLWTIKFPASELKTALFGNFRILFQSSFESFLDDLSSPDPGWTPFCPRTTRNKIFFMWKMWRRERVCVRESGRVCVRVCACAWKRERERESSGYSSSFPLIFFDNFLPVRCTDEQIEKKNLIRNNIRTQSFEENFA